MRPIKLTVEGLNSFSTKQTIDFDKLSSRGVFGIFGKTGSGKSTILDAITLSLYGKVNRARVKTDFVNVKTKETIVVLEFEVQTQTGKKQYEVSRRFKLKKNGKEVDAFATLKQIVGDGIDVVAEGAFNVDAYILNLIGLSMDEFSKCIALPQGEFANFLKAKPNERIELIGNIFDLNEYGAPLWEKVKNRVVLLEKQELEKQSQKDMLGHITEEDVEFCKKDLDFKTSKLNAITEVISAKSQELSVLESIYLKVKNKSVLEKRLAELNFSKPRIERLKQELIVFKNNQEYVKLFSKHSELKQQRQELEQQIEFLKKAEAEKEFAQKETATKLKQVDELYAETIVKNVQTRTVIASCEENSFKLNGVKIQLQKLQNDKENIENQLTNSENEINLLTNKQKLLDEEILQIEKQIESLGEINDEKMFVLNEQIKILKSLDQELEQLKIDADNSFIEKNAVLEKLNEEVRNNTSAFEMACSKLGVCGEEQNFYSKLRDCDILNFEYEKTQFVLDVLNDEIHKLEVEISARKQNIESLDKQKDLLKLDLQQREQDLNQLTVAISKLDMEKEGFIGEHFLELLANEVKIGDECPICKSKVIQKALIRKADASGFYLEQKTLNNQKKQLLIVKQKLETEICSLSARVEFELGHIDFVNNKIRKLSQEKDSVLRKFVDINEQKEENFAKLQQNNQKTMQNLLKMIEINKKISQDNASLEIKKAEFGAYISTKKEFVKNVVDLQSFVLSSIAEKELQLLNYNNSAPQDLVQKRKENTLLQEQLQAKKEIREKLILDLNSANIKYLDLKHSLQNLQEKIEFFEIEQRKLVESIPQEFANIENYKEFLNKINDDELVLKNNKVELEKKYSLLVEEFNKITKQTGLIVQKYEFVCSSLEENEQILKQSKVLGLSIEKESELFSSEKQAEDAEREVENFATELVVCERDLKEIEDLLQTSNFNEDVFAQEKTVLSQKQQEKEDLIADIAKTNENLILKEKNFIEIKKLDFELEKIRKDLSVALELKDLIRGKQLEEFVAQEFIEYIVERASDKLQVLMEGRFDFICENNEFVIIDNFNDGEKRSVVTLSGGEIFVVSLSLALAISDSIIALSNRSFDFFFLDEGFGSLDGELCEVVVNSLYKLQSQNIVIGLISHVPELKEKIKNKIEVKKTEKDGSLVNYSFDF